MRLCLFKIIIHSGFKQTWCTFVHSGCYSYLRSNWWVGTTSVRPPRPCNITSKVFSNFHGSWYDINLIYFPKTAISHFSKKPWLLDIQSENFFLTCIIKNCEHIQKQKKKKNKRDTMNGLLWPDLIMKASSFISSILKPTSYPPLHLFPQNYFMKISSII